VEERSRWETRHRQEREAEDLRHRQGPSTDPLRLLYPRRRVFVGLKIVTKSVSPLLTQ
jgi:hypothetical protein